MTSTADSLPDDIETLKAALLAERAARQESEARAAGAEAMVAHLKLLIAKLKHDRFGAGRIGTEGQRRLDPYPDQAAAAAALARLLGVKRRRGYQDRAW